MIYKIPLFAIISFSSFLSAKPLNKAQKMPVSARIHIERIAEKSMAESLIEARQKWEKHITKNDVTKGRALKCFNQEMDPEKAYNLIATFCAYQSQSPSATQLLFRVSTTSKSLRVSESGRSYTLNQFHLSALLILMGANTRRQFPIELTIPGKKKPQLVVGTAAMIAAYQGRASIFKLLAKRSNPFDISLTTGLTMVEIAQRTTGSQRKKMLKAAKARRGDYTPWYRIVHTGNPPKPSLSEDAETYLKADLLKLP